ncbi:3-dehydroquinate dehydratase [Lentilactobacillus fungorum]|uniref:3-dehydroquinate dehydratase n=1 Tax=Lentilactobacillus fungorum TaxID=2201250 RepID=A0ABQ3W0Z0_9LACO|nr:type I 3-dehydroquinate dehydratase [Lentilactobacillus fungorum]GHP14187.1 3-dehydroquinate dehydratase [Lentilactobacillus fungorum]
MSKAVTVKTTTFSAGTTRIAVPITSRQPDQLITEAKRAIKMHPDVIEWRLDFFNDLDNPAVLKKTGLQLKKLLGNIILLTTFRTATEGGNQALATIDYFQLYQLLITNHLADMLDIELSQNATNVQQLIRLAHNQHITVILSNHDFQRTPTEAEIVRRLVQMQHRHADIAKIAVMPQAADDVLTLVKATKRAAQLLTIPIVTMSMGELGKITRISGPQTGSVLSFATVGKQSAPGQMPIAELRADLTN